MLVYVNIEFLCSQKEKELEVHLISDTKHILMTVLRSYVPITLVKRACKQ